MTKGELITKLEEVLKEIPFLEWAKEFSLEYLYHLKNEHKEKIIEVNYKLEDRTAFAMPIKSETFEEAEKRLRNHLPIFEKYFIYIYSLYEGYLENIGDSDKDKQDIDLLRYRIFRNGIVHNLGLIKQSHIDEFDRKAKEYNPNLTQNELDNLFNFKAEAKIWIMPRDLIKLKDLIENKL